MNSATEFAFTSLETINVCDPLNNRRKDPLLNFILSYLYRFRRDAFPYRSISDILNGLQNAGSTYSEQQLRRGIQRGARQGLFAKYCSDDVTAEPQEAQYKFNPNAPKINPANWPYMCPGAEYMKPGGTCCYKPCRSKKGSVTNDICSQPAFGILAPAGARMEKIVIPGVPGSFERVAPQVSCPIPI